MRQAECGRKYVFFAQTEPVILAPFAGSNPQCRKNTCLQDIICLLHLIVHDLKRYTRCTRNIRNEVLSSAPVSLQLR